jgi:hypothetical protein
MAGVDLVSTVWFKKPSDSPTSKKPHSSRATSTASDLRLMQHADYMKLPEVDFIRTPFESCIAVRFKDQSGCEYKLPKNAPLVERGVLTAWWRASHFYRDTDIPFYEEALRELGDCGVDMVKYRLMKLARGRIDITTDHVPDAQTIQEYLIAGGRSQLADESIVELCERLYDYATKRDLRYIVGDLMSPNQFISGSDGIFRFCDLEGFFDERDDMSQATGMFELYAMVRYVQRFMPGNSGLSEIASNISNELRKSHMSAFLPHIMHFNEIEFGDHEQLEDYFWSPRKLDLSVLRLAGITC